MGVGFMGAMQIMQIRIFETIQQRIFTRSSFELANRFPQINAQYDRPELANRFLTLWAYKGICPKFDRYSFGGDSNCFCTDITLALPSAVYCFWGGLGHIDAFRFSLHRSPRDRNLHRRVQTKI